jgi:hypothetical protein
MTKKGSDLSVFDIKGEVKKVITEVNKSNPASAVTEGLSYKRMSLVMPPNLHLRLKVASPKIGKTMAQVIFDALGPYLDEIEKKVGK